MTAPKKPHTKRYLKAHAKQLTLQWVLKEFKSILTYKNLYDVRTLKGKLITSFLTPSTFIKIATPMMELNDDGTVKHYPDDEKHASKTESTCEDL